MTTKKQKEYNFAVVLNYQAWEAMLRLCGKKAARKLFPHYGAIEKELLKHTPKGAK